MPYAPWNKGWGSCLDAGNACLDGGLADLLTLVPFESIPDDRLFQVSLLSSLEVLSQTVVSLCEMLARPGYDRTRRTTSLYARGAIPPSAVAWVRSIRET